MNTSGMARQGGRRIRLLAPLALAVVCSLGAGDADAGGIPVIDGIHSGMTMQGWMAQYGQMYAEYAKQLEQYARQVEQLQTQVAQYQQMYVRGTTYKPARSYRENIEERFPARALGDGVAESCGSAPKNNPVGLQQYDYCVAIVQTENRRYNAMRQLLQDVADNDRALEEARSEREYEINPRDQGALQANTNKIVSIQSKMENDLQNARYMMDAYNAVLTTLQADMVRAANTALKNQNNLLGAAVQGAALKLALRAARQRDR